VASRHDVVKTQAIDDDAVISHGHAPPAMPNG
jgi:hypothetical protein